MGLVRRNLPVNRALVSECPQCGADIVAPEWSEHVSAHCVRNVWACEGCGYRFEGTVHLSARQTATSSSEELRQLRYVCENPQRLIFAGQLGRQARQT